MIWYLFLDDERYPATGGAVIPTIARNVNDAMWLIQTYGMPNHMSLDHDLGDRRMDGMDFLKTLHHFMLDNDVKFPFTFNYYIHSQNPIGAKNMDLFLKDMIRSIGHESE